MRKRTYEALIVGLVLTAWIPVQARKLAVAAIAFEHSQDLTIKVNRTYLYYLPDFKAH